MRHFLFLLLCILWIADSHAQTSVRRYYTAVVEFTKINKKNIISAKAEIIKQTSPREDSVWIRALEDSLERLAQRKNKIKAGKYLVMARFLMEKDGSVNDIVCTKDPGFGLCEQVLVVIRRFFPRKWGPQLNSSGK